MQYRSPETEAADRTFYSLHRETAGMLEIPKEIQNCDERRGWAARHGCGAIGYSAVTNKRYAYN